MPRIEKLVSIDGRLGVILDVPPTPVEGDSVSIYTADEVRALEKRIRKECAAVCEELEENWATKDAERDALARAAIEIRKL
jgi:hypothetical protein